MGVTVTEEENGIRIQSDISKLRPVTVKTLPYPGFPTDMQAQFTALMAMAKGESTMIETVFENRFQHLEEMRRMGVHSDIMRDTARIVGGKLPRCRGHVDRFTSKCNLGLDGLGSRRRDESQQIKSLRSWLLSIP